MEGEGLPRTALKPRKWRGLASETTKEATGRLSKASHIRVHHLHPWLIPLPCLLGLWVFPFRQPAAGHAA